MNMKVVGIIFAVSMNNANASVCVNKLAELNQKPPMTAEQARCVDSSLDPKVDFTNSKSVLCNADQTNISSQYAQYLKLQMEYQKAMDAYHNEKDPAKRAPLLQSAVSADQRWMLAGREEIAFALLHFSASVTACQK